MKLDKNIKPISYFKEHANEVVRTVTEERTPFVITLHGEPAVVVQDMQTYMEMQNTLALLKILAMGEEDIRQGRVHTLDEAFAHIHGKVKARKVK